MYTLVPDRFYLFVVFALLLNLLNCKLILLPIFAVVYPRRRVITAAIVYSPPLQPTE